MILGLHGPVSSGKDSIALTLVNALGWKRVAFGDRIRRHAEIINPFVVSVRERLVTYVEKHGWDEAKKNSEVRDILQNIGQGAADCYGDDVHTRQASRDIAKHVNDGDCVVVTDIRRESEAAVIHRMGGRVAFVMRPGVGPVNNHKAETPLNPQLADMFIGNTGSLEELSKCVLSIAFTMSNKMPIEKGRLFCTGEYST